MEIPLIRWLDFHVHIVCMVAFAIQFARHPGPTVCEVRKFYFRVSLLTMYKTFIRSQLDYADVIYDQAYNSSFHEKLESLQHNACLTITGAITGTSSEKLYQEWF